MASQRAAWISAISAAETIAWRMSGRMRAPEGAAKLDDLIADLRLLARGLKPSAFPVQQASAIGLAEAFVGAARAMGEAALPELRERIATVLAPVAEVLDEILAGQRDAEAGAWRGQFKD